VAELGRAFPPAAMESGGLGPGGRSVARRLSSVGGCAGWVRCCGASLLLCLPGGSPLSGRGSVPCVRGWQLPIGTDQPEFAWSRIEILA
jgi:hypothetical protein